MTAADAAGAAALRVAHVADVAGRRRRCPTCWLGVRTMTAMPGAPVPRRPAPPPAPHAGPARPRRRDVRAHERPHRPAVRPRGHHRAAADRVAARRRPAQPREPAQGGRRAGRRSASAPSCCSACRRTRTPSAAAPSTPTGIVQLALADLRGDLGDDVVLIADLCVDEYTDHGHCGVLDEHGDVDNDATLEIYAEAALAQAARRRPRRRPERDDGRPGRPHPRRPRRRRASTDVSILAYSAKYAVGLYGPFRDAVDVTIAGGGDRKGYQQDWRNAREALREIDADIAQGADMVMVKPALAYLDVIQAARAARRRARRGVPRQRRVRHDQGRRRQRLDRRRRRRPRAPHGDQAGRRRRHPHVPRPLVRRGSRARRDRATTGLDPVLRPAALRRPPAATRWCASGAGVPSNDALFDALDGGDPRRRQLVDPGLQGRSAAGPYVVARAEGPYVWDVEGTPLHRPRPELRRGHPRPRPPGGHARRWSPRRPTARRTARRRRGR